MSFATEDRRVAESAVQSLESHGYSCWVAWRDIPDGVPYAAAIVQGIRGARMLLVVLTPESRASPHVLREVECAVASNRPILTVQMQSCLPGESLAYYLAPTQWLRNDQDELDQERLVAAVRKLSKNEKDSTAGDGESQSWRTLVQKAFRRPASILFVTGLALVLVTEAVARVIPSDKQGSALTWTSAELARAQVIAAQNRYILLILLSCCLAAGAVIENTIERRRGPYNPLRGRLVPSHAIVEVLFLLGGFWVWNLATTKYSTKDIFWVDGSFALIPDFLLGTGDRTSLWSKIHTALSGDVSSWDLGSAELLELAGSAMILSAVALCLQKLIRSTNVSISITAILPFLLVRPAWDLRGGDNVPSLLYLLAPICAVLLALMFRIVGPKSG